MASSWYNKGVYLVLSGGINLSSNTLKVVLVTSSYTFDPDHNFVSDVNANELTVGGYTGGFGGAGRKTLSNKAFTEDDSSNLAYFDDTVDQTWTSLATGETIGGAIIIREVTNDSDSPVLMFMDVTNTPTNGGNITIAWNASGIAQLVVTP